MSTSPKDISPIPEDPKEPSPLQRQVINLLVKGNLESEICQQVLVRGKPIHRSTISRWKNDPVFKLALDKAIAEAYADERFIKLRIRAKCWKALEYLIQMNSAKAVLRGLELTAPPAESEADTTEFIIQIGDTPEPETESGDA